MAVLMERIANSGFMFVSYLLASDLLLLLGDKLFLPLVPLAHARQVLCNLIRDEYPFQLVIESDRLASSSLNNRFPAWFYARLMCVGGPHRDVG